MSAYHAAHVELHCRTAFPFLAWLPRLRRRNLMPHAIGSAEGGAQQAPSGKKPRKATSGVSFCPEQPALKSKRMPKLDDINVAAQEMLIPPERLKARLPLGASAASSVQQARRQINAILHRRDPRLVVVVGPCSIHDPAAALEYGKRLAKLAGQLDDALLLVMRAYFEKPRTRVGWKGLINDPYLDDSFQVADGLAIARQVLLDLAELGLPLATEALNAITPQYLQDLIAWSAIGARTSESQTHRELASGLSSAVGFKNGTDGTLDAAINAMHSVANPHRFLGISAAGQVAVIETRGNPNAHIVLRGGAAGPNYGPASIAACERAMRQAGLSPTLMVDCSHANSRKNPAAQPGVARAVMAQVANGSRSIVGLMLESHLRAGSQKIPRNLQELRYGVSITDGCIDWPTTESLLREIADGLRPILNSRLACASAT